MAWGRREAFGSEEWVPLMPEEELCPCCSEAAVWHGKQLRKEESRGMQRLLPSALAHQDLGLNFLCLPPLLSEHFPGLHRDGLCYHLVQCCLKSLRELFAASDPQWERDVG